MNATPNGYRFDPAAAADIAPELTTRGRWVLWRTEARGPKGKPTKVPYQPLGRRASTTDQKTWVPFQTALDAFKASPERWSGIGYVFAAGDGLVGVDLDDSLDADGDLLEWASAVFTQLGAAATYGEVSPSGRGIKLWLVGRLPPEPVPGKPGETREPTGKNRKGFGPDGTGGVEVYQSGRFFTTTGRRFRLCAATLGHADEGLDLLYDRLCTPAAAKPPDPPISRPPQAGGDDEGEREDDGDRPPVERCMAYLRKCPDAISGDRGSDKTIRAAAECIRFGLTDAERLDVMRWWNEEKTGGEPWSDAELARKIAAADKLAGSADRGKRLKEKRPRKSTPPRSGAAAADPAGETGTTGTGGWEPDRLSQQVNAERLVHELGGRARYNVDTGQWMVYRPDEGRFVPDVTGAVDRTAKRVARRTWAFVERPPAGIDRDEAFRHAKDSEKAAGIAAAMKLAQTEAGIPVAARDFDREPFLLNTLAGAVDLRTGELLPPSPERLMTKLAPVAYAAAAACPIWERFLDRIMNGNAGMIAYLQRLAGLCCTADASVQELFIPWGGGANGKSVFFDTLHAMLGDYAGVAPESLLTAQAHAQHPTEIADLCGRRLVVASETEQGAKLRVQLVKRLTGDQTLVGRKMRQDFYEFPRTHKMILVTNNKPVIRETTNAVWRRVRLIPFTVTIPKAEQDAQLLEKLRAEWPGILRWAVAGCVDWLANGMRTPNEVMVATDEYQAEQDDLSEYLTERCLLGPKCAVARNTIYDDYVGWAKKLGLEPLDRNSFYDRLRRIDGVADDKMRMEGKTPRVFRGIALATLGAAYNQAQERIAAMGA